MGYEVGQGEPAFFVVVTVQVANHLVYLHMGGTACLVSVLPFLV